MQKHGQMANQVVEEPFTCLICEEVEGFNWSDLHGEGMCNKCGMAYMLLEDGKRITPKINVKEEWISVFKKYWEETHKYMGLGTIMIARDYPECIEGLEALDKWLEEHPELIPEKEEEEEGE